MISLKRREIDIFAHSENLARAQKTIPIENEAIIDELK